jgi:hypothetical protein
MQHKLKIWICTTTSYHKKQKQITTITKEEKKEENLMNKFQKIDSIMNMLSGKIKAELQDATGVELVLLI